MNIVNEQTASGGAYRTTIDGSTAIMTYSRTSPKLIIVDHTQVPDALRGRGIAQQLAAHAIEAAREGGWKIIPLCPFMQSQVARHPEWRDVISG